MQTGISEGGGERRGDSRAQRAQASVRVHPASGSGGRRIRKAHIPAPRRGVPGLQTGLLHGVSLPSCACRGGSSGLLLGPPRAGGAPEGVPSHGIRICGPRGVGEGYRRQETTFRHIPRALSRTARGRGMGCRRREDGAAGHGRSGIIVRSPGEPPGQKGKEE